MCSILRLYIASCSSRLNAIFSISCSLKISGTTFFVHTGTISSVILLLSVFSSSCTPLFAPDPVQDLFNSRSASFTAFFPSLLLFFSQVLVDSTCWSISPARENWRYSVTSWSQFIRLEEMEGVLVALGILGGFFWERIYLDCLFAIFFYFFILMHGHFHFQFSNNPPNLLQRSNQPKPNQQQQLFRQNIFIMKLDSPSELGPWVRYEDTHDHHNLGQKTSNSTFKQQIILPRVNEFKPYIVKPREFKDKPIRRIKVRPLQLGIGLDGDANLMENQPNHAKKSYTLSFDQPKFSFYNKKIAKPINIKEQNTVEGHPNTQRGHSETITKRQVSKVDLKADYLQADNKLELKSSNNSKQRQFSKKRSLMQLLKYLKLSPYRQNDPQTKDFDNKNEKANPLSRYDCYRNAINLSVQAQASYMPYFEARKSLVPMRRK